MKCNVQGNSDRRCILKAAGIAPISIFTRADYKKRVQFGRNKLWLLAWIVAMLTSAREKKCCAKKFMPPHVFSSG